VPPSKLDSLDYFTSYKTNLIFYQKYCYCFETYHSIDWAFTKIDTALTRHRKVSLGMISIKNLGAKKGDSSSPNQISELKSEDPTLKGALKHTANKFIHSSVFGAVRYTVSSFLRQDDPFSVSDMTKTIVETGVDFTAFDFVKSLTNYHYKIDYSKPGVVIPTFAAMSVVSSALSNLVQTPLKNKETNGKYSMKGYWEDTLFGSCSSIGFNTGKLYLGKLIPPSEKMGGAFIRSTAKILAGNLGSTLTTFPIMTVKNKIPVKNIAIGYLMTIPLVITDNALYTSSAKIAHPLMIK